ISVPTTNVCEWSLDGRFLNTTTLSPHLCVGNGVLLCHYLGCLFLRSGRTRCSSSGWRTRCPRAGRGCALASCGQLGDVSFLSWSEVLPSFRQLLRSARR
ncbi:hypothetical protein K525DRAFT_207093, partial [Schizophyllum commune Loenen D]